jgi:hypothetical protein
MMRVHLLFLLVVSIGAALWSRGALQASPPLPRGYLNHQVDAEFLDSRSHHRYVVSHMCAIRLDQQRSWPLVHIVVDGRTIYAKTFGPHWGGARIYREKGGAIIAALRIMGEDNAQLTLIRLDGARPRTICWKQMWLGNFERVANGFALHSAALDSRQRMVERLAWTGRGYETVSVKSLP